MEKRSFKSQIKGIRRRRRSTGLCHIARYFEDFQRD